jgi:hypothetical protein
LFRQNNLKLVCDYLTLVLTIFVNFSLCSALADENALDKLYVITPIFNPASYKSRTNLYFQFAEHMRKSNVTLITIECVYGNSSEFSVTNSNNTNHIQLRTNHPLWHKENLINIAIRRLPSTWKYVLWLDADIEFLESDWPLRVIEAFQKYDIIQVFKYAQNLDPQGEIKEHLFAFTYAIAEDLIINKKYYSSFYPHAGYGWGMTKRAYDQANGLIEIGILGGGDSMMAISLIGRHSEGFIAPSRQFHKNFVKELKEWQERVKIFRDEKKIGYADCVIKHHFHGKMGDRKYVNREKILINSKYDPSKDLYTDDNGLLQVRDTKQKMIDQIFEYFKSRNEDNKISSEEKDRRTPEAILIDAQEKKKKIEAEILAKTKKRSSQKNNSKNRNKRPDCKSEENNSCSDNFQN